MVLEHFDDNTSHYFISPDGPTGPFLFSGRVTPFNENSLLLDNGSVRLFVPSPDGMSIDDVLAEGDDIAFQHRREFVDGESTDIFTFHRNNNLILAYVGAGYARKFYEN